MIGMIVGAGGLGFRFQGLGLGVKKLGGKCSVFSIIPGCLGILRLRTWEFQSLRCRT